MFKRASLEKRREWKEKIEQQKCSGKPVTHWCREKAVPVGQFYYWREQLFPEPVHRSEFLELKPSEKGGIKVECNGLYIHLESHFDVETFKQCLGLLKEL